MFESIPMDLQLFAGEQSIVIDGEKIEIDVEEEKPTPTINDDGDIEIDLEDEEEIEEPAEEIKEVEEKQEPEDAKSDKNPTAGAVIAERKKWQAKLEEANKSGPLVQKLLRMSGLNSLEELQAQLDSAEAAKIAKDTGLTPQQAQLQLNQQRQIDEMNHKLRKQEFNNEVVSLKKDAFFADIDDYREEFEEIASRTNQTLEEVYMSKRGRVRMKEYETEIEQRLKVSQQNKNKVKIDTQGNGEVAQKSRIDLTADERQAAKLGGLTEAEYYKFKKKK